MRNLKKGSRKYKVKLPFKCYNCKKVGHFVAMCLYEKNESSDDGEDHNVKQRKKHNQNNHKEKKHENNLH